MGLLQVLETRVRIVQGKVSHGGTFEERRGKHDNSPTKLGQHVWELALEHLKTIPHRPGHSLYNSQN